MEGDIFILKKDIAEVKDLGALTEEQKLAIREQVLAAREIAILDTARVILALGQFGWDAVLRVLAGSGEAVPRPRPRFRHGAEVAIGERVLIGSYHPSQQNTFTGRLTRGMFRDVLTRARDVAGQAEAF